MYLQVTDYDSREQTAADELPNRVVEMVNPVVFASEGYPMRVRSEKVLWRYMDVMHETRFEMDFGGLHEGGLTAQEFDWLKAVATLARDLSQSHFGKKLSTRGSLSRAIHVFRSIGDLVDFRPLRVFEAGPGSGYLGCLFLKNGWGYAATDITQAFYLLQNRLWHHASEGRLLELAATDMSWDGNVTPGQAVHIPWWQFYGLLEQKIPSVDIVTCNHALAEMHPNSLAFTLRLAHQMLRGEGLKLFVFEGWGFEKLNPRQKVFEQFIRFGFNLIHTDDKVTVFAPQHTIAVPKSGILPAGTAQNHIQSPNGVIQLANNLLTPKITANRARRKAQISAQIEEVNKFYRELLQSDDLRTADERFLDLIGRNYH